MKPIPCKGCGALIIFVEQANGKQHPCDAEPMHFNDCEERELLLMNDGQWFRVNPDHVYPQEESFGYRSHFASCSKAKTFRRN